MLKRYVYYLCKWSGGFALARRITRRGLRILAYHGFILCDEGEFRPLLFMNPEVFRQRMEYLVRHGYPVLSLDDAVQGLRSGDLPPCATAITFDDGFVSFLEKAVPVLVDLKLPATLYMTTYYAVKSNPIFRLVVQYLFWKTTAAELDCDGLGLSEGGTARLPDAASKDKLAWSIIDFAERNMTEEQRVGLCRVLSDRLGVNYDEIVQKRFLTLMDLDEIRQSSESGVDIQLHTHRHVLPLDPKLAEKEIEDNREVLEPLIARRLHHFCYPSGVFHDDHLRPLAKADVTSATTCDFGLNYDDSSLLQLSRFLDGNNVSWIEFEAEMCGFSDLLRKARSWLRSPGRRGGRPSEAIEGS